MTAKEDKIMDKINKNLNVIDDLLMENGFYKYINKIVTIEDNISQLYDDYKLLQQENEKLNHYKLLYQKVKERNDKAIEYVEEQTEGYDTNPIEGTWLYNIYQIEDILKGNNEVSNEDNR